MKLNQITHITSGYHSRRRIEHEPKGTHYLLSIGGIDTLTGIVSEDALTVFTPKLSKNDCIVQENDILLMCRGDRRKAVLVQQVPPNVLVTSSFFVIRTKDSAEVCSAYIGWYLNQPFTQHFLNRFTGQGVSMPVVRRNVVENIDIPLPPLDKQEKISQVYKCIIEEQRLLKTIGEKRFQLAEAVCRESIKDSEKE
ncbi:MAG: restriction endonuclease subunit S [Verrucomicrobiota bacterium]